MGAILSDPESQQISSTALVAFSFKNKKQKKTILRPCEKVVYERSEFQTPPRSEISATAKALRQKESSCTICASDTKLACIIICG